MPPTSTQDPLDDLFRELTPEEQAQVQPVTAADLEQASQEAQKVCDAERSQGGTVDTRSYASCP